jgi:hypothetical protein
LVNLSSRQTSIGTIENKFITLLSAFLLSF